MFGKLAVFKSEKSQAIADAKALLMDAMGMDFESVVIVGIKNGTAETCKSKSLNTLELIGAIELAKNSIFSRWPSRPAR